MWIWAVSLAVTLVAALESWPHWPWAPFLFLHAALGVTIPLLVRCYQWENLHDAWRKHAHPIQLGILEGIGYVAVVGCATTIWLVSAGRLDDPGWNILAGYRHVYRSIAITVGEPVTVTLVFFFVALWAGVGEELFYRGFVYGKLRPLYGVVCANLISSALFGLRHAAQLLYWGSPYPVVSGLFYFSFSAVAGSWLASFYERTSSLWPPIIVHTSVNLIGFPVLMSILQG